MNSLLIEEKKEKRRERRKAGKEEGGKEGGKRKSAGLSCTTYGFNLLRMDPEGGSNVLHIFQEWL